jgi:hypothetical protein
MGVRKLELANSIVQRTLEIIDYLQPKYYIIENPQTGLLKHQPFMQDRPYNDLDYCRYGMPYRKRTRLWNNLPFFQPAQVLQKLCEADDRGQEKAPPSGAAQPQRTLRGLA